MWARVGLAAVGVLFVAVACADDDECGFSLDPGGSAGRAGGMGGNDGDAGAPERGGSTTTSGRGGGGGVGGTASLVAGAGGEAQSAGQGGTPSATQGGAAGDATDLGAVGQSAAGAGGDVAAFSGGLCDESPGGPAEPTQLPVCDQQQNGDPCRNCLTAKCCTEWQGCFGTAPRNACGYGATNESDGQLQCMLTCYFNNENSEPEPDDLLVQCGDQCGNGCDLLTDASAAVVACGYGKCTNECFPFN